MLQGSVLNYRFTLLFTTNLHVIGINRLQTIQSNHIESKMKDLPEVMTDLTSAKNKASFKAWRIQNAFLGPVSAIDKGRNDD